MTNYERYTIEKRGEILDEECIGVLRHFHCVAGDESTIYWYRYACEQLRDRGLLTITSENPLEAIFIHLATLGLLTEEFQTLILEEEECFEYDYSRYIDGLNLFDLNRMMKLWSLSLDECDDDDDSNLGADEEGEEAGNVDYEEREGLMMERMAETLIEHNRSRIVEAVGLGGQRGDAYCALVLTARFPCSLFEDYADMIEKEYPIKVEDLRDRDGFDSYEEYLKFLRSDACSDFVYDRADCCPDDPGYQKAFEWAQLDACPRIN